MEIPQGTPTPVAKKTRSSVRQKHKMEDNAIEAIADDIVIAAPKTPTTAKLIMSETPRRSGRKSVRPPLDYEDIIEKNTMSSATKEKKDATVTTSTGTEEEGGKWAAAEVGRHSSKRHRSRSRKSSKRSKMEKQIMEEVGEEGDDKKQLEEKEQLQSEELKANEEVEEKEETKLKEIAECEKSGENDTTTTVLKSNDEIDNKSIVTMELETIEDAGTNPIEEDTKLNVTVELDLEDTNLDLDTVKENAADPGPISPAAAVPLVESDAELVLESPAAVEKELPSLKAAKLNIDDMDELGLCPLEPEEQEDHDNEMLSLIMYDDEDDDVAEPESNALNITFDADEKPEAVDNEKSSEQQPKHKAYRFPTPLKCKSKPIFKFNDDLTTIVASPKKTSPLTPNNNKNSLQVSSLHQRKRSKSITDLTTQAAKAKTVSFYSPIEVAIVNDIDKRWDALNVGNVTQRRKRSKSLDENRPFMSRIPKPTHFAPAAAAGASVKVATPGTKLKQRTKLPDFAAIHQKQFGKMENLVDHMERKALRAKQLTSSALKLQQQQTLGSTTKKLPVKAEERSRPRALKKIEMTSEVERKIRLPTHRKIEMTSEVERKIRLPTPRKIVDVMASKSKINNPHSRHIATATTTTATSVTKPAFNFSTSITPAPKIFLSNASSSKPIAESVPVNKTEARRQRHMEMFKGGRGTNRVKRGELIRGVRSNRRFELQMQHRRQMDG